MIELAPREMSRQLMSLPVKKRLEVILARADAAAVVAALPVQDFFFFVKEIGPDDALPLLALGQVEQLVHLFDLEWWADDLVQPAKALQWLERLATASEEKLLAWLYDADFELLVTLFKKWLRVVMAPEDIDLLEAGEQLPKHTLDDQYFWETRYVQFEDFLVRLLSLLFEVNQGFYRELMNHLIWVSEAAVEEDAYRFSRGRLEDHAIPDFPDALSIYSRMSPGERRPAKDVAVMAGTAEAPAFALALLSGDDLFSAALAGIQEAHMIDTLRLELASLANKVIVADRLPLDEPQALRQAVAKVAAGVNLGLDLTSQGDVQRAGKIIQEVFLEDLFRLAHTQLLQLKGRLRKLLDRGWLSRWSTGLNCLEPDWAEAAEWLLQQTPRLHQRTVDDGAAASALRDGFFRERRELAQAGRFLEMLAALGPLLDGLSVSPDEATKGLWQEGQVRRLEDLTFGVMIWTAAAQWLLNGVWEVKPIPVDRWAEGFARLQPEATEEAIHCWVDEIITDPRQRELVKAYLRPISQEYAQEMMAFSSDDPPDPRLVKFFMFQSHDPQVVPTTPVP